MGVQIQIVFGVGEERARHGELFASVARVLAAWSQGKSDIPGPHTLKLGAGWKDRSQP